MAIDDIMSLATVQLNMPKGHFKSAYTVGNQIRSLESGGIGKQWILFRTDYNAECPGTIYN